MNEPTVNGRTRGLRVEMDISGSGRAPLRLEAGTKALDLVPSLVRANPVLALVQALHALLDGHPGPSAVLEESRALVELRFRRVDDEMLELRVLRHPSNGVNGVTPEVELAVPVPQRALLLQFWRALTGVEGSLSSETEAALPHPFPHEELHRLGARIRGRR